ncbi:MAG TPA: hypothetical protein VM284_01930 [Candidatus Limnocylindria bacterium]|nr:hypothetical protein [Candidatus Limnocylindria bacterium]
MPTWRCPNCGTRQSDTTRCFLCQRSATSCGTCVKFRSSFVGGLGYCAEDKRREPLNGSEQRPCWTGDATSTSGGFFDSADPGQAAPPAAIERGLHEVLPTRASDR